MRGCAVLLAEAALNGTHEAQSNFLCFFFGNGEVLKIERPFPQICSSCKVMFGDINDGAQQAVVFAGSKRGPASALTFVGNGIGVESSTLRFESTFPRFTRRSIRAARGSA